MENLHNLFDRNIVENISKILCTNRNLDDKLIWVENSNCCFIVKSAYKLEFRNNFSVSSWWKYLWTSKIHERLKFFLWKFANHRLSTASTLLSCNIMAETKDCVYGCGCLESKCHLFFYCQVTKAIWFRFAMEY